MIVAPFFGTDQASARPHPWTETTYPGEFQHFSGKYYDFRKHPELIETVLEDFLPYSDRPAINCFYKMLRWINSDDSSLETNDCAFRGPHASKGDLFDFSIQCDGRVEFFHRDLITNTKPELFYRLVQNFCVFLQQQNPAFACGIAEVSHAQTLFHALPPEQQAGARISLGFIAYGNTEADTFANLKVVFDCIDGAFKRLSEAWPLQSPTK